MKSVRRKPSRRSQRLVNLFSKGGRILITGHDNPDPDTIASAWGIKLLLTNRTPTDCTLGYGGVLGRSENRALVKYLGESFRKTESVKPGEYDGVVVVDAQVGLGNLSLPAELPIVAVIDHHPARADLQAVPLKDIRPSMGSTISMVAQYLREHAIAVDVHTATVFYYAVRSETQELGREAGPADRRLFREMAPLVDWAALHRITHAPVPRSYYTSFKTALERTQLYNSVLFADAGELPVPDAAAEIADWLLRLDEVELALACGTYKGRIVFSLRALSLDRHCGEVAQRIVAGWGSAGGHGLMAGGNIKPAAGGYDRKESIDTLRKRYLEIVGASEASEISDVFSVLPSELSRRQPQS